MRIKYRDFTGGLHLSANPDIQPRNTLQRAQNIAAPINGRLRCASPADVLPDTPGITVDGIFVLNGFYHIEGTTGGVHQWRRQTTAGSAGYTTYTLPVAVGGGAAWNPDDVTGGQQPAVVLPVSSKSTLVYAPPTDGKREAVFALDRRSSAPGQAIKFYFEGDPASAVPVVQRWGILQPTKQNVTGMTLALSTQGRKYINTQNTDPIEADPNAGAEVWVVSSGDEDGLATFSSTGMPSFQSPPAINDGGVEFLPAGGQSMKVRAEKNDVVHSTLDFSASIDLTTFTGGTVPADGVATSVDADFISFFVRVRRPKHLENVEITFSTGDQAYNNTYTKELTFRLVGRRKRRRLIGTGDLIPAGKRMSKFLEENKNLFDDLSLSNELGFQQIPVAKNTWARITIPKNTFDVNGSPTWADIRSVRFTVHANSEGRTAVFFEHLRMLGGVGMQGDYQYTLTFRNSRTGTRSNPSIDRKGVIATENIANVERQGVTITLPSMNLDPQTDRIEVWRTVGNGAEYFKAGEVEIATLGANGLFTPGGSFRDQTSDYIGLHTGHTTEYTQVFGGHTWRGNAVLESESLPIDNDSPNDPAFAFQDAAGTHIGRMWWTRNVSQHDTSILPFPNTTQDGQGNVYYSPIGRYEAVQSFIQVTSGRTDPVQKITIWNDRLFALSRQGFFEIVGADEPFVVDRIEGAPGTILPDTVVATQFGLFYTATDGVYRFNGASVENVTDRDLHPVFRWRDAAGPFAASELWNEAAAGRNGIWYTDAPAAIGGGTASFALLLDFETQTWRYRPLVNYVWYDFTTGRMLGGTSTNVQNLEPFPFNTGETVTFNVRFPRQRISAGQKGICRKVWIDYDPVGESLTPTLIIDGTSTVLATPTTTTGRRQFEYNTNLTIGDYVEFDINVAGCNNPVEIFGAELDIYVPGDSIQESGVAGNQ